MRLRTSDVSWQELDGEIVILDLAGGEYLSLNGSGTLLWRALEGGAERDDLVDLLCSEFDVTAEDAGRDVDAFLQQLEAQGLVER